MTTLRAAFLLFLMIPNACFAVLGEAATSRMREATTQVKVKSGAQINVHNRTEYGLPIKEFIGSDGVVYAVSWHGQNRPDLNALLGKYFPEFTIAAAGTTKHMPRRSLSASSTNLEIRQFGHPGDLHGTILLKNKLPPTVTWNDLQ